MKFSFQEGTPSVVAVIALVTERRSAVFGLQFKLAAYSYDLLGKLIVAQLVKMYLAFYGT